MRGTENWKSFGHIKGICHESLRNSGKYEMELKEALSIVRKLTKGCSSTGCKIHSKNLGTANFCSCGNRLIEAVPAIERILSEFPVEPWLRDEDIEWLKEELRKSLKEAEETLSKFKNWPYNTEDYNREIDEAEKELIEAQKISEKESK